MAGEWCTSLYRPLLQPEHLVRLNSALDELREVSRRALTTMANIDESLDREERKDNLFRIT